MKFITHMFIFASILNADVIHAGKYVYSFNSQGMPVARVDTHSGLIEVASDHGYINKALQRHLKIFDSYQNGELSRFSINEKIQKFTKYFNENIKFELRTLSEEDQKRYLEIFILEGMSK